MEKLVSQADLSKRIADAIKLARDRHKDVEFEQGLFEQDTFRLPWWIVGRVLRDKVDLDQAHKIAEDITRSVGAKDLQLHPVTLRINRNILVGFIERFGRQIEPPAGGAFGGPGGF